MNKYEQMAERLRRMDEQILAMREKRTPISSGFTEDTLRQAIADAKAVRQTALMNARAALDEAFKNASPPDRRRVSQAQTSTRKPKRGIRKED